MYLKKTVAGLVLALLASAASAADIGPYYVHFPGDCQSYEVYVSATSLGYVYGKTYGCNDSQDNVALVGKLVGTSVYMSGGQVVGSVNGNKAILLELDLVKMQAHATMTGPSGISGTSDGAFTLDLKR